MRLVLVCALVALSCQSKSRTIDAGAHVLMLTNADGGQRCALYVASDTSLAIRGPEPRECSVNLRSHLRAAYESACRAAAESPPSTPAQKQREKK